jgi:hypothetical protein
LTKLGWMMCLAIEIWNLQNYIDWSKVWAIVINWSGISLLTQGGHCIIYLGRLVNCCLVARSNQQFKMTRFGTSFFIIFTSPHYNWKRKCNL